MSDVELKTALSTVLEPKTANALADGLGLHTVGELLRHYPRRNQVRGELTPIRELAVGEIVVVEARVVSATSHPLKKDQSWQRGRRKSKTLQRVTVTDGVDDLELVFFNQEFRLGRDFKPGSHAFFEGKIVERWFKDKRSVQLQHPKILREPDDVGGITPVYPASAAISSEVVRASVRLVLDQLGPVEDPLPAAVRAAQGFPDLLEAFRLLHRPESEADSDRAKRRFRYEEAFVLQVILAQRRSAARGMRAKPRDGAAGGVLEAFDGRLPFQLTDGQDSVSRVILTELAGDHPMQRLLQGEVGSGKTVVAVRAMLQVVDSGGQAALLAPTEVLAQQHHRSITELLGPLAERGMLGGSERATQVTLLTGSMAAAARREALLKAASGDAGIVIGTHALLEERVQFQDLGLVVIDEQHRFGVEQRAALSSRAGDGVVPHVLVMTATPIPRTVAMTVFGDLETSTLVELPKGRAPIETHVVDADNPKHMARVWTRIQEEVALGRQAYIVCARINASDEPPKQVSDTTRRPATAVVELWERLRHNELSGVRTDLLHGQMTPDAKDDTMRRFAAGAIDVLVSTTVIEVGVDVPNATVMVVMDADWFGVSQLHQLRGRVGRGSEPSLCLLVTHVAGGPVRDRLDAVAKTLDGFKLSEIDLRQRREGDLLGAAQSGTKRSLMLSVLDDVQVIEDAREAAIATVDADAELADHPALAEAVAEVTADVRADYLERS